MDHLRFRLSSIRNICAVILLLSGIGLWSVLSHAVESTETTESTQSLSLSVSATQSSALVGSTITWTAHASGGTPPYSFCYSLIRTDKNNVAETLIALCSTKASIFYTCDKAGTYQMKVSLMSISNPEYEIDALAIVIIVQDASDLQRPQTGDNARPVLWAGLVFLSAGCLTLFRVRRRRSP